MNRDKNVKAGIFIVIGVVLLIGLITLFRGYEGPTDKYYLYFDNVSGLRAGAAVTYEGYVIGSVNAITPEAKGETMRFRIDVSTKRGWKIPSGSIASVGADSLLSAKGVVLAEGAGDTLAPGSEIRTGVTGMDLSDFSKAAEEITKIAKESLAPMLNTMTHVMDQEGREALGGIAGFASELSAAAPRLVGKTEGTLDQLNKALSDGNLSALEASLANIEQASANANAVLKSADGAINPKTFDELGAAVADMRQAAASVRNVTDTVAPQAAYAGREAFDRLSSISDRLDRAALNIEEMTATLRRNPQALITGTQ
ncbi:MAG: MlaD family protein [Parvibaculales bacterium]